MLILGVNKECIKCRFDLGSFFLTVPYVTLVFCYGHKEGPFGRNDGGLLPFGHMPLILRSSNPSLWSCHFVISLLSFCSSVVFQPLLQTLLCWRCYWDTQDHFCDFVKYCIFALQLFCCAFALCCRLTKPSTQCVGIDLSEKQEFVWGLLLVISDYFLVKWFLLLLQTCTCRYLADDLC